MFFMLGFIAIWYGISLKPSIEMERLHTLTHLDKTATFAKFIPLARQFFFAR